MSQMSDDDLRRQLLCLGEDVGPIINSTRPYWEKRLEKLTQSTNNKKKTSQAKSTKSAPSKCTKTSRLNLTKKPGQIQLRGNVLVYILLLEMWVKFKNKKNSTAVMFITNFITSPKQKAKLIRIEKLN